MFTESVTYTQCHKSENLEGGCKNLFKAGKFDSPLPVELFSGFLLVLTATPDLCHHAVVTRGVYPKLVRSREKHLEPNVSHPSGKKAHGKYLKGGGALKNKWTNLLSVTALLLTRKCRQRCDPYSLRASSSLSL